MIVGGRGVVKEGRPLPPRQRVAAAGAPPPRPPEYEADLSSRAWSGGTRYARLRRAPSVGNPATLSEGRRTFVADSPRAKGSFVRVAAVYDIHANLPALEAVLDEIQREAVDCIIVGGDVLPGPMPHETLDRLLRLDVPVIFIRGNGDRVVMEFLDGKEINEVPEQFHDTIHWTANQLRPEHRAALSSWPLTHRLKIDGIGDVLFCHATPRNDFEVFTSRTSGDRLTVRDRSTCRGRDTRVVRANGGKVSGADIRVSDRPSAKES